MTFMTGIVLPGMAHSMTSCSLGKGKSPIIIIMDIMVMMNMLVTMMMMMSKMIVMTMMMMMVMVIMMITMRMLTMITMRRQSSFCYTTTACPSEPHHLYDYDP